MFIFVLMFLVLAIAGIVVVVCNLSSHARSKPSEGALGLLKQCYARGEIQNGGFEENRKDLGLEHNPNLVAGFDILRLPVSTTHARENC